MTDFLQSPFVIGGTPIALMSTGLAWLAYRRGKRADEHAEDIAATTQVYAGYDQLLVNLQNDNRDCRQRAILLEKRILYLEKRALNGGPVR